MRDWQQTERTLRDSFMLLVNHTRCPYQHISQTVFTLYRCFSLHNSYQKAVPEFFFSDTQKTFSSFWSNFIHDWFILICSYTSTVFCFSSSFPSAAYSCLISLCSLNSYYLPFFQAKKGNSFIFLPVLSTAFSLNRRFRPFLYLLLLK